MPIFLFYIGFFSCHVTAVNFEAKLEDGTLVAKADGVEFTVGDGNYVPFTLIEKRCRF